MYSIVQEAVGAPSVLRLVEVAQPSPGSGEVLVRVAAAGVNPVDAAVRSGAFPLLGDPPFTVGWDVAGTIEDVGPGVQAFQAGDEVLGLVNFPNAAGAYAQYVVAPVDQVVRRPTNLPPVAAGALPMAALTAWQALVGIAELGPGRRVLIQAAAGGVGHVAVQLAKARGAYVIGTASAAKHAFVRDLGADEVVDYTTTDVAAAIEPVDVALDLVGGAVAEQSVAAVRLGGLVVAAVGSRLGRAKELAPESGKRLEIVSVRPSGPDLAELAALVEAGRLRVHVEHALPLAEAAKAHELIESQRTTGKIVLVP
jgi:NADPH:quinone reductase-like Zn-dependent oxidoreductase